MATMEKSSFDELANELADGTLSRSRAIKLMGAALLGGALSFVALPDEARARTRRRICDEKKLPLKVLNETQGQYSSDPRPTSPSSAGIRAVSSSTSTRVATRCP